MSSSNNLASSNLDPSLAATPLSNGHDASLTSARIYARHLFPAHGAHVYLLLELIALFPAEVRTLLRIARRWQQQHTEERHQQQEYGDFSSGIKMRKRRPDGLVSLHEVGLFVIKYIALVAVLCQIIGVLSRNLLSARGCAVTLYTSNFALFVDTSLVTASFAWRAYLVCGKTRRSALFLSVGCLLHLAAALAEAQGLRDAQVIDGFCREPFSQPASVEELRIETWWSRRSLWFTLYSTVFDTAICATSCYKLLQTRHKGLGVGWLPTCKVLFDSATYYMASMTSINLAQMTFMLIRPHVAPSSVVLAASVQVVLGLHFIVKILDRVHGDHDDDGGGLDDHREGAGMRAGEVMRCKCVSQGTTLGGWSAGGGGGGGQSVAGGQGKPLLKVVTLPSP